MSLSANATQYTYQPLFGQTVWVLHLNPNECLDAPSTGHLECYSLRELSKEEQLLKDVSAPESFVCSSYVWEATKSHACSFFEGWIQTLRAPSFNAFL